MWFEKIDLDENPFEDTESTQLIGYDEILDEALYRVESGGILVIESKKGTGKTAVLKQIINKYKGHGRVAYVDSTLVVEPNIENVLLQKYGLRGRLFKKMPQQMILLVDDIETLSEKNNERIKFFYDQNYIKSIVFTTSDVKKVKFSESLKQRIGKIIKLNEITENHAIDIINSRIPNNEILKEDAIKEIFKISKKNLKEFIKNSEILVKYAVENKVEITKDNIKDILAGNEVKQEEIKIEDPIEIKEEEPKEEKKEEPKEKPKKEKPKKEEPQEEIKIEQEEKPIKVVYEDIAEKYY